MARAGDRLSASEETPNLMLRRARKSHSIDRVFLHPSIAAHARLVVLMSADVAASPEAMDAPDAEAIAAYADGLVHAAGSTHGARTIHVYPVTNYSFGSKAAKEEKDATVAEAMVRQKATYQKEGMRRTVCAVLLVNQRGHPHVLLMRTSKGLFKLPGGRLRQGEGEIGGLRRKLHNKLSPVEPKLRQKEWDVGECVARWCRPSHEPNFYPYLPAHCTRPKESVAVFVSELPNKCVFAVPKNTKLLAVPLFEMYGNEQRYGALIASIPHLVSRYNMQLEDE